MPMKNLMLISSDGHATARMDDYREYIDPEYKEEFEKFCVVYREKGTKNFEEPAMRLRLDPEEVEQWVKTVVRTGRLRGYSDPVARLREMESQGVSGEVIIPEFGLPFELYSPSIASLLNYPPRTPGQIDAGNQAYNRWLAYFCSVAPERFAGMASVRFDDPALAIEEIERAHDSGLKGVMIPTFTEELPLFDPHFDPIWSVIEEREMVLTSHTAISATSDQPRVHYPVPHPVTALRLNSSTRLFFTHQILDHLVWGGVFERHPRLKVVFTEQGSGWVPSKLASMDYSYTGSYLRRDIREVVRHLPSEYFARQCWIGSSLLSRAEVAARHEIGVEKMMVGVDYPHHEGTWYGGNIEYLKATFGAERVPEPEARLMLGETIARVYGFDVARLAPVVERIGPLPEEVLSPPAEDRFPRGDVHKPLTGAII
jgi:predicted TIM-barrel fold metal-dependent hydrolase